MTLVDLFAPSCESSPFILTHPDLSASCEAFDGWPDFGVLQINAMLDKELSAAIHGPYQAK